MATLTDLRNSLIQNENIKEALESKEYIRSRKIFKKRMEIGFSQIELAKASGLTQKTISRIEGGDPGVRENTIVKVYAALGMKEEGASLAKKYVVHH